MKEGNDKEGNEKTKSERRKNLGKEEINLTFVRTRKLYLNNTT